MIGVIRKVLVYGFPFFLLFVEWTFRSISGTDAQTFMGPTLASVGVGFLLPLLSPKKRDLGLSETTRMEAEEAGISLIPKNEEILIYLSFVCIIVLTALWVWDTLLIFGDCKSPLGILTSLPMGWTLVLHCRGHPLRS
jgi:hypothetical protein